MISSAAAKIQGVDRSLDSQPAVAPSSASNMKVRNPAIWPGFSSSALRFSRSMPTSAPSRIAVAKSSATDRSSRYSMLRSALFGVLRVKRGEAVAGGWRHPALGDETGDQACRRHVETEIGGGASVGSDLHRGDRAVRKLAAHELHLVAAALLDGNGAAILDAPVDGGEGERHEEGNVIVPRGERLQIGADLVGDVAGRRGAVGTD